MSASELRTLPDQELLAQAEALRRSLWEARIKMRSGGEQQTHRSRQIRRQIARVKTVLREKAKAMRSQS